METSRVNIYRSIQDEREKNTKPQSRKEEL